MDELFLSRLKDMFGSDAKRVIASMDSEVLPAVRVNTLVVEEHVGIATLQELGFEPKQVLDGFNAYVLHARTKRDLTDTQEYKDGWYYIQSLSSMIPVWTIQDEVREKISQGEDLMVIDMCAAPGSKTSQLAVVMENRGQIVAYDVSRQRMYMLKANLEQQHVSNAFPQLGTADGVWRKYGPIFDVVLLDAPCSGEGRFKSYDEESYADWSIKKIERWSAEQRRLLFSAVMCLKSGGVLVYSTCTFAPEENEANVQFILEKFEGAIEIEEIGLKKKLPDVFVDGLGAWQGNTFDPTIRHSLRVKPLGNWEGFFVCKIRRK